MEKAKDLEFFEQQLRKLKCHSWAIIDTQTGKQLYGYNENAQTYIASLTKILTMYIAFREIDKRNINIFSTVMVVSYHSALIKGASALLQEGDKILLKDLLYAMNLPSGNDAATLVAEYIGELLLQDNQQNQRNSKFVSKVNLTNPKQIQSNLKITQSSSKVNSLNNSKKRVTRFVAEMNQFCQQNGLKNSVYFNPHGNGQNKSTALEQCKLGWMLNKMTNELALKIIKTAEYVIYLKDVNESKIQIMLKHINRLLRMEDSNGTWQGIKDGWTEQSGASILSQYEYTQQQQNYIVCLLGLKQKDYRWTYPQQVIEYTIYKQFGESIQINKQFPEKGIVAQRDIIEKNTYLSMNITPTSQTYTPSMNAFDIISNQNSGGQNNKYLLSTEGLGDPFQKRNSKNFQHPPISSKRNSTVKDVPLSPSNK